MKRLITIVLLLAVVTAAFGWKADPTALNRALRRNGIRMFTATWGKCRLFPNTAIIVTKEETKKRNKVKIIRAICVADEKIWHETKPYFICIKMHLQTRPNSLYHVDGLIRAYIMRSQDMHVLADLAVENGYDSSKAIKFLDQKSWSFVPEKFKALKWTEGTFLSTDGMTTGRETHGR